jgi:hypothetical protein
VAAKTIKKRGKSTQPVVVVDDARIVKLEGGRWCGRGARGEALLNRTGAKVSVE